MLKRLYYQLRNLCAHRGEKGEISGGYWHHRIRQVACELCLKETGILLEIGCGEGLFLKAMIPSSTHTVLCGMDICRQQLLKARHRTNGVGARPLFLVQADAVTPPFKESVYATIVCINFFLNVESDPLFERLLGAMHRVLMRGGALVFDIRNARNPLVQLKYRCARLYDGTLAHKALRAYHLRWVEERLHSSGFEIETVRRIGFPHRALAPVLVVKARKQ